MGIFTDSDGNKGWKPNPHPTDLRQKNPQQVFLDLPDTIFEALYGGAAFGGKSEAGMMLPIYRQWHLQPTFKGVFFRRTFPQLDDSIVPRMKEIYPIFGGTYNDTKHVWTFPNPANPKLSGAKIWLSYMENLEDARKHDSAEYNYIFLDELTHFERELYIYITSRCRSGTKGLPAIIRAASNPGNIGNSWVRERFVEPFPTGNAILQEHLPNGAILKRIFIPARATDNVVGLDNDPNYVNNLHLLPEHEKRAKLYGDWWAFEGQVFPEFRSVRYPDEPEDALHVIPPFTIPSWWPKLLAIDWGYTHKTACHWGAVSPDGRLFIYREYCVNKTKVSTWAADIARLSQFDGNIAGIVIDPSANQNRGQDQTIKEQFQATSGLVAFDADNDRMGGKVLIHDLFRWVSRPQRYIPKEGFNPDTAQRILRVHGLKGYDDYFNLFQPEPPETNLPRVQIFNTCIDLIDTIPNLIYDEHKTEDVKKFDGDDAYDSFRYLCKYYERYAEESKELFVKHSKLDGIVKDYESTKDANVFYRRMERFEADNKEVIAIFPGRRGRVTKFVKSAYN